jgi:membrane fusion protein, heavy metal efflux system
LSKTIKATDTGAETSLAIESPADGIARGVFVAAGQPVSPGAPLFEVVNQDVVWVRVAVYVGELNELAVDKPAVIKPLGESAGGGSTPAKPIAAPPSATAATASRDLYYEVDNGKGALTPGQRVSVVLPAAGEAESLVVPWSAVVHDVNGGAWLYAVVGPHAYARRRVQVKHVDGADAVLADGPAAGTVVATRGVAELFGKEMGFAK